MQVERSNHPSQPRKDTTMSEPDAQVCPNCLDDAYGDECLCLHSVGRERDWAGIAEDRAERDAERAEDLECDHD